MDWIKKHYDQFALGVFALALLACSGLIIAKATGFNATFAGLDQEPSRNNTIKPLNMEPLTVANQKLATPVSWNHEPANGNLFVSAHYIIDPATGKLRNIDVLAAGVGLHPPITDAWIKKYSPPLDLLSSTIKEEDPDKDGFSNLEEFLGGGIKQPDGTYSANPSTDPTDPKSMPPYYTKLFLEKWIKVPFLLLFQSFDGDPAKPETLTFGINPLSLRASTEFLSIGQMVPKTKFKVEKFEYKTAMNEKTEVEMDVSELTLRNTETNDTVVLVITKPGNSPDSYASFSYNWPQPAQKIQVKKLQEFVLKPNVKERFKLLDITDTHALIALPDGKQYTVPLLPK